MGFCAGMSVSQLFTNSSFDVKRDCDDDESHLVICDVIVRAHALNLHWAEHPAHVVNDLDICRRRL